MGYISHKDGSYYEGDMQVGDSVGDRPLPSLAQVKAAASAAFQAQIDAIEAGQRTAIREAVLNKPGAMAKLTLIDNQVAALRTQKGAL